MSIHLPSFSDLFVQILLLMLRFFIVNNAITNVVIAFEKKSNGKVANAVYFSQYFSAKVSILNQCTVKPTLSYHPQNISSS